MRAVLCSVFLFPSFFPVSVSQTTRVFGQASVSRTSEIVTPSFYQRSRNVTTPAPTGVTLSSCQTILLSVSTNSSAHESQSVSCWPAVSSPTSISSSSKGIALSSCQTVRLSVSAYPSANESQSVSCWPAVSSPTSISSSAKATERYPNTPTLNTTERYPNITPTLEMSVSQSTRVAAQTSVSRTSEIVMPSFYQRSRNVTTPAPTGVTLSSCQTILLSVSTNSSAHESQSVSCWPARSSPTSISSSSKGLALSSCQTVRLSVSAYPSVNESQSVSCWPAVSSPTSISSFAKATERYPNTPTLNTTERYPNITPTLETTLSGDNMYPYGPQQNDSEFRLEDSPYFSSYHCLRIDTDRTGFPFFSERHYKLHICRNGIIQLNYEWSWWWPRKFGAYWWLKNMAIIAPFWATTDTYSAFRDGHSKVYYHLHKRGYIKSSAAILSMASEHVQRYTGKFKNFEASWVLVVTWKKLCPYVYYYYYDNCRWSNTFQAVLITDGFNTFLMYNYPHGGIQWVIPANRAYYRYWTGYYGLPVSGWNAGGGGRNYLNIKGSGTLFGMYNLDRKAGNTGLLGRHFWRIENSNVKNALEKCFTWTLLQQRINVREWYNQLIRSDWRMACPCTEWQAWLDWGRFSWDWWHSWPELCYESRRSKFIPYSNSATGLRGFRLRQQCCYSTQWEDWGSLKEGLPNGGRVQVKAVYNWFNEENEMEKIYTDQEAYKFCCVDTPLCDLFYFYRPSDRCSLYRPPRRRWFWGDPHFKTLDGRNYTFNGLGEYVMIDAQNGTFQLQARTKPAQGNSTTATIFSAGAAKEENTSTIEVRVKKGGGLDILIDHKNYNGYDKLTNQSVKAGSNLSISKPEKNCLQVSFPSTMSVNFCAKKEMLSFVVTPADDYKNNTKGLLGTWNDDPEDDFTLPNGTVLPSSLSLKEIHFKFGIKWQIKQSQSLFTYAQNESVDTFKDTDFEPMFADNITWYNDSLRKQAEAECGDDYECLFDVASTNDLSVGMVTKGISVQLVNESNKLENFPPKIVAQTSVINATLYKTVELNITAVDNDTITFRVIMINKPAGAVERKSGNVLYFSWNVTSRQKFNLSFVAADDKGASATWSPTINMCACDHGGQCVPPEEGDKVNTDSKFVYMGCTCQGGYTGRFCDSEIDACESNGQPCYTGVECIDLPPPANASGYKCGPCPSGYTGDGAHCVDFDECQKDSSNNCKQLCVNLPAFFSCDCHDGYTLNADGRSCDDIDECESSNDCMQKCINSLGSYNCSCDEFFKPDPTDWRKCSAKKPCSSDHDCQHVCFKGNDDQPTCTCYANYKLDSDGKTCRDVNECDPDNPRHRCSQICENTPGSYNCSCEKGFELNKDGYQCEDINECVDEDFYNCTDEFHKCVNTRGSYKCECEQDLYFIDGKCTGLEKNETAPKPVLPEPRVPSKKEREEAVQFLIPLTGNFEWDFETDKSFKEKLASITTDYCAKNRTKCALKESSRQKNSPFLNLYTADQVHLLPGYPSNASGSLQVVFYVQQPLGLFIEDKAVLPHDTLINIVKTQKSALERAIGANISDVESWSKPTESPTAGPAEPSSNNWKWVGIGIGVGVVVIALVVVFVFWCLKEKVKSEVNPMMEISPPEGIHMKHYGQSVSSLEYEALKENASHQT